MKVLPIARPVLGEEEAAAAREAILSGWVTQGPRVKAFEEAFTRRMAAPHAVATSNCTTALHLALLAAGVQPGDCVATVSCSFIATANAVRAAGAEPFFLEVDPLTANLDPAALARFLADDCEERNGHLHLRRPERLRSGAESAWRSTDPARTGRVAAVLTVHQVGMPCDLGRILPLCARHRLPVIEDAACAAGSAWSPDGGTTWRPIGSPEGLLACFSFHPRKVITTGDGGMVTTRDAALDARLRLLRQHGMDVGDLARHQANDVVIEGYSVTGFNYRLTDVQAAMGIEQLKRLDGLVARRRAIYGRYRELLGSHRGLGFPVEPAWARSNWQSLQVLLPAGSDQRAVMRSLLAQGIHTRPGVMCAHLERPYADQWPDGCLPGSEKVRRNGLILPLFDGMDDADVGRVAEALFGALR